jgi:hypothetical protein
MPSGLARLLGVWRHPIFAGVVAVLFVLAAAGAMKVAALYARFKVDPLQRLRSDNAKAIVFYIVAMLLVMAALVVPLVIRRRAQRETTAAKPEKLAP